MSDLCTTLHINRLMRGDDLVILGKRLRTISCKPDLLVADLHVPAFCLLAIKRFRLTSHGYVPKLCTSPKKFAVTSRGERI